MYFYRNESNGVIVAWQSSDVPLHDDCLIEISEEEYTTAIEELQRRVESEAAEAEQSKDERIAELEAENAALIYQVLTGEELTDV